MQFDVGLSFEITTPKCNSCSLVLLSLIFKIRYMHSYKHIWVFLGGTLHVCTQCIGNFQPVLEISLPNISRVFQALQWDYRGVLMM